MLLKYATAQDRLYWGCGSWFSIATALVPAASTVLIGRLFNGLTDFMSQKISSELFMAHTLQYCIGLFALAAANCVISACSGIIWRLIGFQIGHRTRLALFKAYCDGDLEWMDANDNAVGVASQAFEDVKRVETASGIAVSLMIETLTTIISCYAVAFYYSWQVTLVCTASFPVFIAIMMFSNPYLEKFSRKRKFLEDSGNSRLHFIFDALATVKVFRKQQYEYNACDSLFKRIYKAENAMMQVSFVQRAVIRFFTLTIFVQGFYFGSFMVTSRGLAAGAVMSTFWACIEGASAIQGISNILVLLAEGSVSAGRLDKIIENKDDTERLKNSIGLIRPLSAVPMDIIFDNVVFSYPSRPELVLRGLDMHLRAGQIHYIIGPSGCGKSSVASILLKQYAIQAGKVCIGDNVLENMARQWIHENVTLVEQNAKLFDLPIMDNLRMGSKNPNLVTHEVVNDALHEFQCDFVYELPQGIHTLGSFPLSGGQQQRIQLAKAWISNTPVMIFDESTSALDQALEREVMKSIRHFRHGRTTIIITHNLDNIPDDHPIHLIEDGEAHWFRSIAAMKLAKNNLDKSLDNLRNNRRSRVMAQEIEEINLQRRASTIYEDYELKQQALEFVESVHSSASDQSTSMTLEYWKSIPCKFLLLIGFIMVTLQAILTPVFSLVFSKLLMGILPGSGTKVTFWAMMVLMVAGLDSITTYSSIILEIVASKWCLNSRGHILNNLVQYSGIAKDDIAYYKKLLVGDMEAARGIIVQYWRGWTNLIALGSTGLIWAMAVGWKLSLVGLALVPLVVASAYYYKSINHGWSRRLEAQSLEVKRMLEDIVTGYRSVKTQNLDKFFEKHYLKREESLWNIAIRMSIFTSLCGGVLEIFTPLAQGLLLWFGFKLISTNEYTAEKTMLVFTMLIFSLVTLDNVARAIQQCGHAFEALPRIMDTYHDTVPFEMDAVVQDYDEGRLDDLDWGRITFANVSVTDTLVQNFSTTVTPGQCTAIVGPSGSGKTTLSRLLLKLQVQSSGTIYVDGIDLLRIPSDMVRRNIVIAAQMPLHFFEGTILENLCYGLDPNFATHYEDLAIQYCQKCGLHDYISSLELNYQTIVKKGCLSGGQMQRLGIVRALMTGPRVIILDEPTSALDENSEQMIKLIITECCSIGITVVLITHQESMRKIAHSTISII